MSRMMRWICVLVLGLLASGGAWGQTVVEYIHTDALGSVVAVTDASGDVIERREYEPYGAQLTPAVQDGPGYTGHVQDAATGLVYMQQRYYDPGIGRFLSVDPVTAYEKPITNFNRYVYARNNPYKFTDPDGRDVICNGTTCNIRCRGAECVGDLAEYGMIRMVSDAADIARVLFPIIQRIDTADSAGDKIRDGTKPAKGRSGDKGEREGSGGQAGADGAFDSVDGSNERSPRDGVRIKDLDGGGTIETHSSTKSADYPQGTPTVKVQDANGKVETTVRYPEEKSK